MSQSPAISLQAILNELSIAQADETLYLHKSSGQLQLVAESSIAGLCDADEKAIPEREKAFIDRVRSVLTSGEWLALPNLIDERDLGALRRFIGSLADGTPAKTSLQSLLKSNFAQPILERLEAEDLEEDWQQFRRQQFFQQLQTCLNQQGLSLGDDSTQTSHTAQNHAAQNKA